MHILVLTFLDYPSYEGGAIRLRHISRALAARGHRITVVAPAIDFQTPAKESSGAESILRIPMHYLPRVARLPFLPRLVFAIQFTRAVRALWAAAEIRGDVDLIQIEEQFPLVAPAVFLKSRTGAPILLDDVVLFHAIVSAKARRSFGPALARAAAWSLLRAERAAFARCDYFTYASARAQDYLGERGFCGHVFFPNGVDTAHFRPGPRRRRSVERQVFFSASPRSDQNLQAIENLLDATPRIQSRCRRPVRVDIVCGPRAWVPPRILQKARAVAGVTLHDTLPDILPLIQEADLTVLPYTPGHHITGGARLKALEYLACGKVLVSTPEGVEGLAGLVPGTHYLETPTLEGLIDLTVGVLERPAAYAPIGERGRSLVLERYSWEAVTQDYLSFVESVAGRRT